MGLGKKSGIDLDKAGTEMFVIEAVNYILFITVYKPCICEKETHK